MDYKKRTGGFSDILVPIHREGYPFIILFAVLTLLLTIIWGWFLLPCGLITAWCIYFFRDPERVTPSGDLAKNVIFSPADGFIQYVGPSKLPAELQKKAKFDGEYTKISVFMNVFNVHVNRMPCNARVITNYYHHGQFLNASLDKSSELNERQSLLLADDNGNEIGMVQIAGLVARRIVCYAPEGSEWLAGTRYGIIRFGSRVDLYLPTNSKILVAVGQTAVGGETRLAESPVTQQS